MSYSAAETDIFDSFLDMMTKMTAETKSKTLSTTDLIELEKTISTPELFTNYVALRVLEDLFNGVCELETALKKQIEPTPLRLENGSATGRLPWPALESEVELSW